MHNSPAHYLDNDGNASRLMAHARLLLKLARRFEAVAPSAFRHAARVANFKSGKIVIHADNGAVAAKIRQMSQRLCGELSRGGTECSELEVKVQPRESFYKSIPLPQKPLSETACGALRASADKMPEGPLRQAIARLLESATKAERAPGAQ